MDFSISNTVEPMGTLTGNIEVCNTCRQRHGYYEIFLKNEKCFVTLRHICKSLTDG